MRIWLAVGSVLALLGAPGSPGLAQRPDAAAPAPAPRAAPSQPARAPQDRTIFVANELGLAMRELYVTPAGSVEPGEDLLGSETLPNGATLRVLLGRQPLCLFDVRVVLADGTAQDKRGLDICRGNRVTFGDPSLPLRDAVVENATDLTMRELYAAPVDGRQNRADRGPDRLGAEVVGPDSTFTLRLGRVRDCVFDVTAVFEDDSVEEKRRVDLCRRARVSFGDPSVPRRELEVANGAGRTMRSLLAATSPVAPGQERPQDRWGPDRLGGATVEAGDTFPLRLRSRACQADLRATYEDDTVEDKRGVELCSGTGRVLFDGSGIPRAPERAFVLVNRHSAAVEEAYASDTNDTEWGDDRLSGALERGGRQEVVMHGGCEIDLRIVFGNGSAEERRGIDVCATQMVVLRPDWVLAEKLDRNPGPIERAPPREGSVRLRNAGGAPVVELYVAPADAPRGPDRLGATVLGQGEALDFQPPEGVGCTATLSAVFRDGRTITRPDFNLCSGAEVTLP
jgi:ribosome-associated protein YbcJ (S4-like RNA binding protein)